MKVLEQGSGSKATPPPVSDVAIGAGELWLPAKELNDIMIQVCGETNPSEQLVAEVERVLTRHAADFASLFAIKPPSPVDRDQLQKCSTEGRYLKGFRGKHVISYQLVSEAIMLSDMFQINEFVALDLLTLAENEAENYGDWPRGLIAVSMFYEGRLWLMRSLCLMIRVSPGRQWQSNFNPQIIIAFRRILNSAFREDLIDRLTNLLESFSMSKQLELLESNLALGDARHRRKVKGLLTAIQDTLSHTIFCYACQRSLRWPELSRIMDHLKENCCREEFSKGDTTLIATCLYTIETTLSPPDTDLPFGQSLRKYLKDNSQAPWKCPELYDVIRLSFLIAAHKLPTGIGRSPSTSPIPADLSTPIRGDSLVAALLGNDSGDMEFNRNLFGFLQASVFIHPDYYTWDADISKVFHGYFVDFITFMPLKLKEMKYRSEEIMKHMIVCNETGIAPSINAYPEFEAFLECLGEFYEHDPYELGRYYFVEQSEFLPLSKLVRSCCLENPTMFESSMRFMRGVSTGNNLAMFDILRQSGHSASLEHFFESMAAYLKSFGMQMTMETPDSLASTHQNMSPSETRSICSYLRVVESVCDRSETARLFFTGQKPHWIRTALQVVKIKKFPREVRAAMLDCCASMIGTEQLSPDVIATLWDVFYSVKLIDPGTGDVKEELEEKETRLEEYSLTIGMLRLIKSLVQSRFRQMEYVSQEGYFVQPTYDNGSIFPYINYVTETVFLKMPYRLYKDANQRWHIMKLCTEILSTLLDYLPKLMIQLVCDSPLVRTLLNSLVDCALASDMSTSDNTQPFKEEVDRCSLSLLVLLWRALQRQEFYLSQRKEIMESQDTMVLLGIHKIMMNTSADGSPDYILAVIRFVDSLFSSPEHMRTALEILSIILEDRTEVDYLLHHALTWHEGIANVFRQTIIEVLFKTNCGDEAGDKDDELKISALKLIRTSAVHQDPNVGMYLLGFDVKKGEFQGERSVIQALIENSSSIPTSFMTLMTLIQDPRMSDATLKMLRYTRFFVGYLKEQELLTSLNLEGLSYFLKCLAIELKCEDGKGPLSEFLVGEGFTRLDQVLKVIQWENKPLECPDLEFFDSQLVLGAVKQCEYVDGELKTRLVRVEKLDGMLKDEIGRLEKSTVLRLRKTVHSEAKEILQFAKSLNTSRIREGNKLLVFDGWRQVVEVLALSGSKEFAPGVSRLLLCKATGEGTNGPDFFLKMAAETLLTLCAVMSPNNGEDSSLRVGGAALSVMIHKLCQWLASSQNPNVRGILYACMLYCVNMLDVGKQGLNDTLLASQQAFPSIMHNLCKDCCQGVGERTRMQALYLMGEIIKTTTHRGLGGGSVVGSRLVGPTRGNSIVKDTVEEMADESLESSFLDGLNTKTGDFNSTMRNRSSGAFSSPRASFRDGDKITGSSSIHERIMTCIYTNGFLSTLVEALCFVDDIDLIALLTSESSQDGGNVVAMRAFFVFEAKLTMLSRLAGVGLTSVIHLMDLNLLKRLTDMKVFELQSYHIHQTNPAEGQDTNPTRGWRESQNFRDRRSGAAPVSDENEPPTYSTTSFGPPLAMSTPAQTRPLPRMPLTEGPETSSSSDDHSTISESLYIQVFKLFLVMVTSAPKNVQVISEILQFLRRHDIALSKLLHPNRITSQDTSRSASQMLMNLMTKLAGNRQRIVSRIPLFPQTCTMKPAVYNILRLQAEKNIARDDQVATSLVKQSLLFLYYSCKVLEDSIIIDSVPGKKSKLIQPHIKEPVLTNRFELDRVLQRQDENCSLGVIFHCVSNIAQNLCDSQIKEKKQSRIITADLSPPENNPSQVGTGLLTSRSTTFLSPKMAVDCQDIMEIGLTLIFYHTQYFVAELQEEKELKRGNNLGSYQNQMMQEVETHFVKVVTEAAKRLDNEDFIGKMLLKIRRLAAAGEGAEGDARKKFASDRYPFKL